MDAPTIVAIILLVLASCLVAYREGRYQTEILRQVAEQAHALSGEILEDYNDLADKYGDLRAKYEHLHYSYRIAYEMLKENDLLKEVADDRPEHEVAEGGACE